ncbi:HAD family hydrolase [Kibdelosporangium aridum]|uniref:Phosphoglycolate phosphatase n=1 Tax=Kibdelosporangium aridum TaxID=2030 RepID=A0A1W2FY24_KIBAR|nr:HAD hydrolase-like protein [Kibdelosporangium aridum]SMD26825.1 phosphoglycolate phosphatase [Kibdelosporangium aridum]
MTVTVGFDLDMTLIDPRQGIVKAIAALAEETGLSLDGEYIAANMGPPLRDMFLSIGIPEDRIDTSVARFRATYPEIVIPTTVPMPGAAAALKAVRAAGGQTLIVTAKYQRNAELHVEALGWEVDHLIGDLWSAGKADALKLHGAGVYVGDHIGDMKGAAAAGAVAVGVTTGPCDAAMLTEAGADVVLSSLVEFPAWFNDAAPR